MITFEKKWTKHYSNGNDYEKYIVKIIGGLLQNLRRENNHRLDDLAKRIGVPARTGLYCSSMNCVRLKDLICI